MFRDHQVEVSTTEVSVRLSEHDFNDRIWYERYCDCSLCMAYIKNDNVWALARQLLIFRVSIAERMGEALA